jgi:hypothetical protein
MLRRLVRRLGWLTIAQMGWRHRGTVVRGVDALRRAPVNVRADRARDTLTELRAVAALAGTGGLATRTDVRVGSVGDGCIVLEGPSGDTEVERARAALLGVRGVVDVRAEDGVIDGVSSSASTVRTTPPRTPSRVPTIPVAPDAG